MVRGGGQGGVGPGIIGEEAGSETWPTEPFLSGQNFANFVQICPNHDLASLRMLKFVRIRYQGYPEPPKIPELSGAMQNRVLCTIQV